MAFNVGDTVRIVDDYTPDSPFIGLEGTLVGIASEPNEWAVKIKPTNETLAEYAIGQEAGYIVDGKTMLGYDAPPAPDTVFFFEWELELVQSAQVAA